MIYYNYAMYTVGCADALTQLGFHKQASELLRTHTLQDLLKEAAFGSEQFQRVHHVVKRLMERVGLPRGEAERIHGILQQNVDKINKHAPVLLHKLPHSIHFEFGPHKHKLVAERMGGALSPRYELMTVLEPHHVTGAPKVTSDFLKGHGLLGGMPALPKLPKL